METPQKQSLAVPIAIVLAGALIGLAVYMSGRSSTPAPATTATNTQQARDITVRPLSSSDHIIGSPSADVVLFEYSDTECPFCKAFHATLKTLQSDYSGQVAWVYRHFPIAQLHSKAPREAQATECAADQGKFWPFINRIFEITPSNDGLLDSQLPEIAQYVGMDVNTFNSCLSSGKYASAVSASVQEAQELGANGTPTSFLVLKNALSDKKVDDIMYIFAQYRQPDGSLIGGVSKDKKTVFISGALPYDFMKGILDLILKA